MLLFICCDLRSECPNFCKNGTARGTLLPKLGVLRGVPFMDCSPWTWIIFVADAGCLLFKVKQRKGGICDRLGVQLYRQFNNNKALTHNCNNHMNDNNNHNINMANITNKWVVNLSSTPLTDAQTSLLARGPKFTIVPRHLPKGDYATAVEEVSHILTPNVAAELRADTSKLLNRTHPPGPTSQHKKLRLLRN